MRFHLVIKAFVLMGVPDVIISAGKLMSDLGQISLFAV
jgi:hypothetical protein